MPPQNKDALSHNNGLNMMEDTELLTDLPSSELTSRLKELDAEISLLERAHIGTDDEGDLPSLSASEQHDLNWMISWENFDRMIENNTKDLASQIHIENGALTNIALEKLYQSCGDTETANKHMAKTNTIIENYAIEVFDDNLEWTDKNPFQDDHLTELFKKQWAEMAKQIEHV